METSEFLNSADRTMIGIVLCGLLVLAVIILPKVFRYKKRMKEKQQTESDDVEIMVVQESESKPVTTEQRLLDYETLFLVNAEITARSGKQVGIRKKYHERIMKIVQVIGKNEVSIFSYVDNVLKHHFETFQDEITEQYDKNKDAF